MAPNEKVITALIKTLLVRCLHCLRAQQDTGKDWYRMLGKAAFGQQKNQ